MKIVSVSNYINHHQIPLSDAISEELGPDYFFIQTEPMEEERKSMGWEASLKECPYLLHYYEEPEKCARLILESDIVIFGGVEEEAYIRERLKLGKIVIRSSERLYKEGTWKAISPRGLWKKYQDHTKYRKAPVYLLCDGGYVASDFHVVRAYPNKMFRFGYFPKLIEYDIQVLLEQKKQNKKIEILWAGRMIPWKHPELVVRFAEKIKCQETKVHITMIGNGICRNEMVETIERAGLTDIISMEDFMPPDEIRKKMERADIFLFTSDYKEGWGAVLNEAMNSGCAVVASHAPGATPYLIRDGENGLVYQSQNLQEFQEQVQKLIEDATLRMKLGRGAYQTIAGEWNAQHAARVLLAQCKRLLEGKNVKFESSGPMSQAPVIAQRHMYRKLKEKAKNE